MANVKQETINRAAVLYLVVLVSSLAVLGKIIYTMSVEGDFWRGLRKREIKIVDVAPERGNILACDGKLLAATVPTYVLYMDFKADGLTRALFDSLLPPLCDSLATVYDVTPAEMKTHLRSGYNKGSRYFRVNARKLTYVELNRVKTFPLYNMGTNTSGLTPYEQVKRNNPFYPLSMRTVGSLYAEADKGGKCGIEQYFDSILSGFPGRSQTVYVGSHPKQLTIVDPIDGLDVMTTLDVNIMDITDNALRNTLDRVQAVKGCAVIMEVKTGQIKAMSNLHRTENGDYVEDENFAVNSKTEPGSTFKIASAIVALENGIDTSKIVDTENGVWHIYGKNMKDWNANKGGSGKISLNRGIQISSNIVIAKIIEEKFGKEPEKYIEALYKMGLNTPLNIELSGAANPRIKNTDDPTWSKLSLPWISHGYELQLPPINLLAFYNGLANDGVMIQPYLVKGLYHNGQLVESFEEKDRVINKHLCSRKTLDKVRQMMIDVVEHGTAGTVKTPYFKVAGKTGTAVQNFNGRRSHQLTFCGFFPADAPKYSMVVVVWYPQAPVYPSAGAISGEVFRNVAEQVYAISPLTRTNVDNYTKSGEESRFYPITKEGNYDAMVKALSGLGLDYQLEGEIRTVGQTKKRWCWTKPLDDKKITLTNLYVPSERMRRVPNVIGMGAKDAVFLMENSGLEVRLNGYGTVYSQSIESDRAVTDGMVVELKLK